MGVYVAAHRKLKSAHVFKAMGVAIVGSGVYLKRLKKPLEARLKWPSFRLLTTPNETGIVHN